MQLENKEEEEADEGEEEGKGCTKTKRWMCEEGEEEEEMLKWKS